MEEVTFELTLEGQKEPVMQTSREREFQALSTCKGPLSRTRRDWITGGQCRRGGAGWGVEDGGEEAVYCEGAILGNWLL